MWPNSSKKSRHGSDPPPSRQCLYFGNFWTGIPSLRMNNNGQTLEQMLYVHVAMIMMRSIRRTTPPPMATCFFLFSHHICLCSFDSTFWNCLFLCVGVIRKYVQALSDITVFMLQKRNCVFEKNISTVDKNNQPRTVLCRQPACQPSHEKLSLNSCYDII